MLVTKGQILVPFLLLLESKNIIGGRKTIRFKIQKKGEEKEEGSEEPD